MQLELNSNSQIEFKYIELKRNVIQIDAKGIEKNVLTDYGVEEKKTKNLRKNTKFKKPQFQSSLLENQLNKFLNICFFKKPAISVFFTWESAKQIP